MSICHVMQHKVRNEKTGHEPAARHAVSGISVPQDKPAAAVRRDGFGAGDALTGSLPSTPTGDEANKLIDA